jgi:acyl-CoA synthetase (NDP forming)
MMTVKQKVEQMERIFCPKSIAIFGVSATKVGFGSIFLRANISSGYEGKIYPIGSNGGEIFGIKIYKSLQEVPGPVDLACIAVPAHSVIPVLEECLKYGVAGAQIQTSGFGELGTEEGIRLEAEIAAFGKRGLRIIGPNCFGIHCPYCGLTIIPGYKFPKKPGSVAFFGQSGGMAADLGNSAPGMGFGCRRIVSYGNSCDVDAAELLEIFAEDPECKVITSYIEGVRDGRRLFNALREASLKKPVILWKAGLTDSGSRAVMSHTGSLGGAETVWQAAMKQAGAIPVSSQVELLDTVVAFLNLGEWMGKGIAIIGGGGALGVASADTADSHGFCLPEFSESTREAMQALLPPVGTSFRNPADVGSPMVPPQILGQIMEQAAHDPNIDIVVLIQIMHYITLNTRFAMGQPDLSLEEISWHEEMAETCKSVREKTGVPVVQLFPRVTFNSENIELEEVIWKAREASHAAGVPSFPSIDRAIAALERVVTYWKWRNRASVG